MPTVRVNGRSVIVTSGTPLDVAIRKAGYWGLFRSVKYGRLRDIMDSSHIYPQYTCVEVKGWGLVNPLDFHVDGDLEATLHTQASVGSTLSGKIPLFGVGFQNMRPIRSGVGWRLARRLILSSANLPKHTAMPPATKAEVKNIKTGVLIVGAGPAGLGLASVLSERGSEFMIVDQHGSPGGRLRFAVHIEPLKEVLGVPFDSLGKLGDHITRGSFLGLYEEEVGLVASGNTIIRAEFEKLVFATGSRCPPPLFAGNDTPGVISVDYALRLYHYDLLEPPIVFYVEDEWGRMVYEALSRKLESTLVSPRPLDGRAASHILGVKRAGGELNVTLEGGRRIRAKLVVYSTVRQPSLELPAQAGFNYTLSGEKLVCVESLEERWASKGAVWVAGSATGLYELSDAYNHGRALGWLLLGEKGLAEKLAPQPVKPQGENGLDGVRPDAFICFCEDVKVSDFAHTGNMGAEKTKRATGWGTGVCQGKLCLANGLRLLNDTPYTQRLPVQPTPLALLAALGEQSEPQGV